MIVAMIVSAVFIVFAEYVSHQNARTIFRAQSYDDVGEKPNI
jgi:hypothetical protein